MKHKICFKYTSADRYSIKAVPWWNLYELLLTIGYVRHYVRDKDWFYDFGE
jgi:hypothetical protein